MGEGVVVDRMPIATHERADEEQKGRLRLMEIRDELIHDAELEAGLDHDLRLGM